MPKKRPPAASLRVNGKIVANAAGVRRVCAELGFVPERGSSVPTSPRQMLEAIGCGDAIVMNLADDLEYDQAEKLRALAQAQHGMLADLLLRMAKSLELAKKLSLETDIEGSKE